ncbi:MAG: gluconolaconase [Bacteroidota bacterium]
MKTLLYLTIPVLLLTGCNSRKQAGQATEAETAPVYALQEIWRTDSVLRTCESVLFDEVHQLLYVSCINGAPWEKDGQGYISVLEPDGTVKSLEWVSGLDAPKGMGLLGNLLYVADVDQLVVIDIEKGEIKEKIPIPGAAQLNDVAVGEDGKVYFSDSGTGWLWICENGETKPWIREGLQRPNGLFVEEARVLLASSESSDLKVIDKATGTFETVTTGIGQGDGVESTGQEGTYIVTSWAGEIFLVLPDFSKVTLLKTSDQGINSADIGFNVKEQVVYVPTFFQNRLVAYKLVK